VLANSTYRKLGAGFVNLDRPGIHYRDIMRANIAAGFHPEAAGREEEYIEEFIRDRYRSGTDLEREVIPGRWVLMRDRVTPSGDLVCVRTDISEMKQREGELRQLSLAVEQSPASVMISNAGGDLVYVNKTFTKLTGYNAEEVIGKPGSILQADGMPDEVYAAIRGARLTNRAWRGELLTRRKDGSNYLARTSVTPITQPDGKTTHYLYFSEDITELRDRDIALRESEERFRGIFEEAGTGIVTIDNRGLIVDANDAFCELVGYGREELKGTEVGELSHPDDKWIGLERRDLLWDSAERQSASEERLIRKDGGVVWVLLNRSVVKDENGTPLLFYRQVQDITRSKELEANLRRLSSAVEYSPAAVFLTDPKGKIEYVNPKFVSLYGFSLDEIRGKRMSDMRCEATPSHVYEDLWETISSGREWQGELIAKKKDGTEFWIKLTAAPVYSEDGTLINYLSINEDISERKEREAKLRQLSLAIEQCPAAIVISDPQARIEYVNAKFETMTGYALDEVRGKPTGLLRSGQTPETTYEEIERSMQANGEWRGELTTRRKDGSVFVERVIVTVFKSEDGSVVNHLRISEDITELEEQEHRLRESEAMFRVVFEDAGTGMAMTDLDGTIIAVNRAFSEMLEYTRDEMKGMSIFDVNHPDDVEAAAEGMRTQAANVHPVDDPPGDKILERRYLTKSGRTIWVSRTRNVIRDDTGAAKFFVGHAQNITKRMEAERALRDSEERFRGIFEVAGSGMVLVTADGKIVSANPAYARMLGYSQDELKGMSILDLTHPEDRRTTEHLIEEQTDLMSEALNRDELEVEEKRYITKDGRTIWVSVNRARIRDESGEPIFYFGHVQNITEQKRAADALQKSEERYRLIVEALDHISDGIEIIGPDETFVYCNDRQKEFYPESKDLYVPGTSLEELVRAVAYGGRVHNAVGREEEWIADRLVDFRQGKNPPREFRQPDGRWLYVREFRTDDGSLVCLRTDITDQKRHEEALRTSEQQLSTVTANLFEGVIVLDTAGTIQFMNPAARRFLHSEAEADLSGRHVDAVIRVSEKSKIVDFSDGPMKRAIEGGQIVRDDDAVFQTAEGEALEVAFACAPLRTNKNVTGCVLSFRDIKDVKVAQRESLQSLKLASVGELAAGIAHEINTPSQYIGDNLRFIRDSFGELSDAIGEFQRLVDSLRSIERLAGSIERFENSVGKTDLDFLLSEIPAAAEQSLAGIEQISHIVSAMKEFSHPGAKEKVPTNINQAIENTVTVSRNEWKHVADLETDLDPALPFVPCLTSELNQVFLNLIVNASHAIQDSGRPERGAIKIETARIGHGVEIRISDNGSGIAPEIRDKIFDPFFTTKDVGRGTGQGLAICHDVIVNKHQGTISCDSEVGVGTTFTVRLPYQKDQHLTEAAE
jgi:PAS domain S-box-containing protein